MALALDDLRRQVLGRPAQRPRPVRHNLRKPKVSDLDVPRLGDEQVLRLQVPVHNVEAVQVLKRHHNLGGVELGRVGREPALLAEVGEQLAPGNELPRDAGIVEHVRRGAHLSRGRQPRAIARCCVDGAAEQPRHDL